MNDNVKHKWLMLDKDVASVLLSMDNNYWKEYLRSDGRILVSTTSRKLQFWWNVMLTKVFVENGYKQMEKDKCVLVKSDAGRVSYCAITVDDCFFVATKDENWILENVKMLEDAFEELTLERGDTINILGMTVHMERDKKNRGVGQVGFEPIPGQSRLGQWGQTEMASAHRLSRLEPRLAHFVSSRLRLGLGSPLTQ